MWIHFSLSYKICNCKQAEHKFNRSHCAYHVGGLQAYTAGGLQAYTAGGHMQVVCQNPEHISEAKNVGTPECFPEECYKCYSAWCVVMMLPRWGENSRQEKVYRCHKVPFSKLSCSTCWCSLLLRMVSTEILDSGPPHNGKYLHEVR